MFVATDIVDPELEPHGSIVATYGFCTNPTNLIPLAYLKLIVA